MTTAVGVVERPPWLRGAERVANPDSAAPHSALPPGPLARLMTPATLTWVAVACGIWLRVSQFLTDRSLFLDEAFVATNILSRDYAGLLGTLEFDQRAPLGFLVAVKFFWESLGHDDRVLRLAPLLASIAGLFVFRRIAARLLEPWFQVLATTFFALTIPQIFYASDLKQYSLDVLKIGRAHV